MSKIGRRATTGLRGHRPMEINSFTCIMMANLQGSDSPPMPTPVHNECWEYRGQIGGYTRAFKANWFIVDGKSYQSLPDGATCFFCKKVL